MIATGRTMAPSLQAALFACLVTPVAVGCGGRAPAVVIGVPPARTTKAPLVGQLCTSEGCRCREAGDSSQGPGLPPDGRKRFELRLGPGASDIWVILDDMVLFKDQKTTTSCFYVDLAPGEHTLGLRAQAAGQAGLRAAVEVAEYGTAAAAWYETFRFSCGDRGPCTDAELAAAKEVYRATPRGIHDPCGSVRVGDIVWETITEPDAVIPRDLALSLTLNVYRFAPDKAPGDPTCKRPEQ